MEANPVSPTTTPITHAHPLFLLAAASVTVLSLAGVAALAGWLPGPGTQGSSPQTVALATPPPPVVAPVAAQPSVTAPRKKVKLLATPSRHVAASVQKPEPEPRALSSAVPPAPTFVAAAPVPPVCHDCGVIAAVNEVTIEPKGSGGGAVAGGVVGGLLGNQIGKGATRDIATIIGAVGGAFAGNHIEKSSKESKRYDVLVRFEDGSTRTFSSESRPVWQSGDRVRLQNGLLTNAGGSSGSNVAI